MRQSCSSPPCSPGCLASVLAAGLVWGVLPAAVAVARPLWMPRRLDDLPDLYDNIGLGLTGVQLFVLPIGGRFADRGWA
jgi:hypothetical protein